MKDLQYINILADSLKKKYHILKEIEEFNQAQTELLCGDEVEMDEWEALVDKKEELIQEILRLDEGFESVYQQVREELDNNRQDYTAQIKRMQESISDITALSVDIQAQEARNKELAKKVFSTLKKKSKSIKQSNHVANIYDTNMKKLNLIDAQFLDQKK